MNTPEQCFPNKWECALIMLMFEKGIIIFDEQEIFTSKISFKRAMKKLHDWEIVLEHHYKNSDSQYKLTDLGEDIAKILRYISGLK